MVNSVWITKAFSIKCYKLFDLTLLLSKLILEKLEKSYLFIGMQVNAIAQLQKRQRHSCETLTV